MHHKENWILNARLLRYYLKNTPNKKKPCIHRTWSIKIAKKIWFAKQSFIVSVPHILVKNNTPKKGKEKECYLSTTFLLNKTSSTLTLVQKKFWSICPNRPPQHTVDKTQWLQMSFVILWQGKWREMFLWKNTVCVGNCHNFLPHGYKWLYLNLRPWGLEII